MVTMRALFLLFSMALGGAALAQHDHAGHMKQGMSKGELGASAAFDRDHAFWAVYQEGGHIMVRRSADIGRNWSPSMKVNATPEPFDVGADARPKIAFGPRGEIFVTWTTTLAKPYTGNIRFARSLDRGRSFTAPMTVHKDPQEIGHRFDALTVTPEGKLFIVWVDKRDQVASGKPGAYRGAALYFAVSSDSGATFRGDFKLIEHSCECCRIALLPRDDGSVLAFWRHVFEPDIRDHALARITADGRVSGFRRATFDDWHIDVCPHHGPSLAADDKGRLHAVWFSGNPGRSGAFYGRLLQDRVDGERRIGGATAEHADIALFGQRIAIAWKEFDGERSVLKAMRSEDGGETWTESELAATSGASDQPRLLSNKGRFYVFWNTRQQPLLVRPLP